MTDDDIKQFAKRGREEREAARVCCDVQEASVRPLLADRYEAVAQAYRALDGSRLGGFNGS